jgi:uncharacterized protein (DUF433 family)
MSTTFYYPHIRGGFGEPACLERWPRIRVAQIAMDHLARAWSSEEISRQYPHLALSEIHSALAYYFDHQEEIDAEIQSEIKQTDAAARLSRVSPLAVKLATLAHS